MGKFIKRAVLEGANSAYKIAKLNVLGFSYPCSPLKYNFARKLASLDPRVMVSNPDQGIKMFQEVLQRLIETRWKTSEEADTVLAEYRKLVSDAKRYHLDKFSSFKITTDRLDSFLFEVLQNQ